MSITEPKSDEPEHNDHGHGDEPGRDPHKHPDHHWVQIVINAKQFEVDDEYLTYDDILMLEFNGNPPSGPNWSIVVTYSRGPIENPQGSLKKDHSVKIKQGMVFRVRATDRS